MSHDHACAAIGGRPANGLLVGETIVFKAIRTPKWPKNGPSCLVAGHLFCIQFLFWGLLMKPTSIEHRGKRRKAPYIWRSQRLDGAAADTTHDPSYHKGEPQGMPHPAFPPSVATVD